jgi:hypothetical protein
VSGSQILVDRAELETLRQRVESLQVTVTAILRRGSPFEILTVRDVAARYHVGPGRVLAAIAAEQLKATRRSGRGGFAYSIAATDAHRWYEQHVSGAA